MEGAWKSKHRKPLLKGPIFVDELLRSFRRHQVKAGGIRSRWFSGTCKGCQKIAVTRNCPDRDRKKQFWTTQALKISDVAA